jgi:hypothetical protein
MVPVVVMGPPVRPVPVATLVTVPEFVPGKVWPAAKVIRPLEPISNPLSAAGLPPVAVCRSNWPLGFTNHWNRVGFVPSDPANCKA